MDFLAFFVKTEKDAEESKCEESFCKLLVQGYDWSLIKHAQCAGKALPNQCEKCMWRKTFHDARNGIGGTNQVFKLLADKPVPVTWSDSKKKSRAIRQAKKVKDDNSSASGRAPVKPKSNKKSNLRKMVSSQLKAKSEEGKLNSIISSAIQVTGEVRTKRIAEVDKLLASLALTDNVISYGKHKQSFEDDDSKLGLYGVLAAQGEGLAKFGMTKVVKGKSGSGSSSTFAEALAQAPKTLDKSPATSVAGDESDAEVDSDSDGEGDE